MNSAFAHPKCLPVPYCCNRHKSTHLSAHPAVSGPAAAPNLHAWMQSAGAQAGPAPTPARHELAGLIDAAAEGRQLRKEIELLREAEVSFDNGLWRGDMDVRGVPTHPGRACALKSSCPTRKQYGMIARPACAPPRIAHAGQHRFPHPQLDIAAREADEAARTFSMLVCGSGVTLQRLGQPHGWQCV
jgi:hypothetical protein